MGQVLYFVGIILFVIGLVGLVLFGNEPLRGRYPNYGRRMLWLLGAGIVLFVLGYVFEF